MDTLLLLFLPMILALGIITSYEDMKYGKIRNKFIVYSLVYAVLAYLMVVIYLVFTGFEVRIPYIFDMIVNVVICITFGFVAWSVRLWSAADAKLFLAYTALVPLSVYTRTYFTYFPAFVLLINTFVPAFIYIMYRIITQTSSMEKINVLMSLNARELVVHILNLLWMIWVIRIITSFLNINAGLLTMFLIIFILKYPLRRFIGKDKFRIAALILFARVFFDFQYIMTVRFVYEVIGISILMVLMLLVMNLIRYFSDRPYLGLLIMHVHIQSLKAGMMLAEDIYKDGRVYRKGIQQKDKKPKPIPLKLESVSEGLTIKDVDTLKKLYRGKRLAFSEVNIKQTVPFAPFMFIGVLLTIINNGVLINVFIPSL